MERVEAIAGELIRVVLTTPGGTGYRRDVRYSVSRLRSRSRDPASGAASRGCAQGVCRRLSRSPV